MFYKIFIDLLFLLNMSICHLIDGKMFNSREKTEFDYILLDLNIFGKTFSI